MLNIYRIAGVLIAKILFLVQLDRFPLHILLMVLTTSSSVPIGLWCLRINSALFLNSGGSLLGYSTKDKKKAIIPNATGNKMNINTIYTSAGLATFVTTNSMSKRKTIKPMISVA
ncbi:hypothetical protein CL630_04070 [bacterium]|nr:hypothetical protein [bacterium]|tara:strand:- start:95878 stop:96222 length:345 start_codon:yes stop_codon:yes gene_type:complete